MLDVATAPSAASRPNRRAALARTAAANWDLIALAVILLVGAGLRIWFMDLWRPALLGYPDSGPYINSSVSNFVDHMRPGGYPVFLEVLRDLSPHLALVVWVQHLLGLLSAVFVFAAVWQFGAPRWAGLLPATVVTLSGAGIWLEHAILSDTLFVFLLSLALLATALAARTWREATALPTIVFAAVAGAALGLSIPVRAAGAFVVPLVVLYLLLAAPGSWKARAGASVALLLAVAVPVLGYMAWYDSANGRFAMTESQFYNEYGRVASFADCTRFSPPSGTAMLCPDVPVRDRMGHEWWVFDPASPIMRTWGDGAFGSPPPEAAGKVQDFAIAAVLGQPLDYLKAVGRDLVRIVDPGFPRSTNPKIGNANAGLGPDELVAVLQDPGWTANAERQYAPHYRTYGTVRHDLGGMEAYERVARLDGVPLVVLLLLALAGPWLVRTRRERLAAGLLLAVALALLVGPVLIAKYDWRFTIPAQGPLAAAAAFGVVGLVQRLRTRMRRSRPSMVAEAASPSPSS